MLEVALGAAAPVASDDVLAAVLAAVVALTFVHICKRSRASSEPPSAAVSQVLRSLTHLPEKPEGKARKNLSPKKLF